MIFITIFCKEGARLKTNVYIEFYGEQVFEADVIAEAKTYYKEVFGIDLTDEQAQSIFEPVQSAGEGFAYQ